MCSRSSIIEILEKLLESDDPKERSAARKMKLMSQDRDREKALRTLLDERGPGQRRILPEHRPLGGLLPHVTTETILSGQPVEY